MIACRCVCGADLALGDTNGIWTLADTAVEYRTCKACKSTRAFMPRDVVRGRYVQLFADPETSEIYMGSEDGTACEWTSLLEALEFPPPSPRAELIRNGVVLARTYCGIDGVHGWRVCLPLHEPDCTV